MVGMGTRARSFNALARLLNRVQQAGFYRYERYVDWNSYTQHEHVAQEQHFNYNYRTNPRRVRS